MPWPLQTPLPPFPALLRHAWSGRTAQLWVALAVVLTVAIGASVFGARSLFEWSRLPTCPDQSCPALATVETFRHYQPPRLFDRNQNLVAFLPGRVSVWVEIEEMSPWLVNGVVAVEDQRFYDHGGIDVRSIVRAASRNLKAGTTVEGASTITMQLVRVLWADGFNSYWKWRRKAVELRGARALEQRLTKEQILELYLNNVYLGHGVYGVEAAAREYFGTSASEVTLSEAAALIGAIKGPTLYNPRNTDPARGRRDLVLGLMEDAGIATAPLAAAARREQLDAVQGSPRHQASSYFAATVDRELRRLVPEPSLRSGARVLTTLDTAIQTSAEMRLLEQIETIERGELGTFHAARTEGDTIAGQVLQGAMVVLDMTSGAVRGVVGGRSFEGSRFNRALQARRQPGSAFKPFVFGAALEARTLTLADLLDLSPLQIETDEGLWEPRDPVEDTTGIPVREAMALSSNTAAVRVGMDAGLSAVRSFSRRVGIESPISRYPSSYLGASEMTPVELASAYATIGNGGRTVRPHFIVRVEAPNGSVIHERDTVPPGRAIGRDVAHLVHELLVEVVNRGTGYTVRRAGYWGPAAGKTGTTDGGRDAWFVGYNGAVSAAVWIGFDAPRSIARNANGASLAAPVWARVMSDVYGTSGPRHGWLPPSTLTTATVDAGLGLRIPDGCPSTRPTREELFLPGTEPQAFCPGLLVPEGLELLITEPISAPPRKRNNLPGEGPKGPAW